MRYYMTQTDDSGAPEVRFAATDEATRAMTKGDRIVFYQVRGEGDAARGVFVAWGEVDRVSAEPDGDGGVAHLKAVSTLGRRVPFSDLRTDPRRNREAELQAVSAEVFNQVLARSRR